MIWFFLNSTVTLTLKIQSRIMNGPSLQNRWSDCHETKAAWTSWLVCFVHGLNNWSCLWPWPCTFKFNIKIVIYSNYLNPSQWINGMNFWIMRYLVWKYLIYFIICGSVTLEIRWSNVLHMALKITDTQTGWWMFEQTAVTSIIPYDRERKRNIVKNTVLD